MKRPRLSPWLGRRRTLDGQTFEVVAVERVRSRAGRFVPTLRWRSVCASCGDCYEFRTHRRPANGTLERYCRRHAPVPGRVLRPHQHVGRTTPGILDMLVAEDPDGTLTTMSGEIIRGPRKRREPDDIGISQADVLNAVRRLLAAEANRINSVEEADHGR